MQPVLVRDAAEVLGVSAQEICTELLKLGHHPRRSINMAISGEELLAVATAIKALSQPAICTWTKPNDPHMPDTFVSNCGLVWTFTDGGPGENNVRYCPGCGGKLVEGQP